MPFRKFVETGRVAYITKGRYGRRLCSIVDVVDQNRALIDGPSTGVPRMAIKLKHLRLTKFVEKFPFRASTKVVRKVWTDKKIKEKWDASTWAKNLAKRRARHQLTDYDRFKLRYARSIRNKIRTKAYIKLYQADKKARGKLKYENRGKKGYNRRGKKTADDQAAGKTPAKEAPGKATAKQVPGKATAKQVRGKAPEKQAPGKTTEKKATGKAPEKQAAGKTTAQKGSGKQAQGKK